MSQEQLFASFLLDNDSGLEIALNAGSVIEATPLQGGIKPLPGGVDFLEGIMQLREKFVPVINLKKRFGLGRTAYSGEAKIAVVSLYDQLLGLMVDDIREVFRAEQEAITPVSPMLQSGDAMVSAIIQRDGGQRTVELIDLKSIFRNGVKLVADAGVAAPQPGAHKQAIWSRFVVFRCCGQEYGVPVEYAQEISFLTKIDEMFRSGLLEGALDLRGRTVPVMRASRLLAAGGDVCDPDDENCRILVLASEECCFGLIVEDVREILTVPDDEILRLTQGQPGNLKGIYQRPSGTNVLLLDMPSLVCHQLDDLKSMSRLKNGDGGGAIRVHQTVASTHHLITENCYLIFSIAKHFGIELKDVVEIIESVHVLPVPGYGGYHAGVINLRGEIVPVVNLRRFYHVDETTPGSRESGRLIICHGHGRKVALEVDSIVTIYKQQQYHATPSLHPKMGAIKDTLDRLIEFRSETDQVEHVLVVNVHNMIRNHLDSATGSEEASGAKK